jgi:hypothetical protein
MKRFAIIVILGFFFSCKNKQSDFSYSPINSNSPLLVSEIGQSLEIVEVQTIHPISGTPIIFKSDKYFYLFEQGIITSLHQIELTGTHRKSIDFGFDDKLNANAITQVLIDQNRVGIITHGHKISWFDEDLMEMGTEELPIKAKVHFRQGTQTIAHTNRIDDDVWDIVTYGPDGFKTYLPIDKNRYGFYNQTFSPFSEWRKQVLFSQAFNDTVYVWDQTDFSPLFHVDFGTNAVPKDRFSQIQSAMDMIGFFSEKKYSFLQGEVFGLDSDRILFQVNEKGKQRLGLMDFNSEELKIYPGLVDNSISGISLFAPQFTKDGVLYFGISGERILENYNRLPDSFKRRLSKNYAEAFYIYQLKLK